MSSKQFWLGQNRNSGTEHYFRNYSHPSLSFLPQLSIDRFIRSPVDFRLFLFNLSPHSYHWHRLHSNTLNIMVTAKNVRFLKDSRWGKNVRFLWDSRWDKKCQKISQGWWPNHFLAFCTLVNYPTFFVNFLMIFVFWSIFWHFFIFNDFLIFY